MSEPDDEPSRPRFGAADRRALIAVATQFFVNGALFASFVPRLPEIRDRVGVDVAAVGLLLSVGAAAGYVGSLVVSPAIGRFGTRRVMLGGGALLAGSLALIAVAETPVALLIGLACFNLFDVLMDVGMNLQGSWLSARRHAPVMNRLHGMWSLGTLLGGLVSSRLAAAGVAVGTHLIGVAAALLVVLGLVSRGLLRRDEHDAAGAQRPEDVPLLRRLRGSGLPVVFGLGALALVMENAPYDWAAFRLSDDLGARVGVAALGYVAVTVGMTAGRFGGDHVVARWGPERLRRAALASVAVGMLVASLVDVVAAVVVGFAVVGLGNATVLPGLYDRAARWPGPAGAGLGALTGGMRTAMLLGPALVGVLAQATASVGTALAIVSLPCVAALMILGTRGSLAR